MNKQAGFSLVEILVALSLLALAGTFVIGKIYDRMEEGNVNATKIQIRNFMSLLQDYRRYCHKYPASTAGLDALLADSRPSEAECPRYPTNGFIEKNSIPMDPWGNPYQYEADGGKFLLFSYGADGQEGGEGTAADIRSDNL